MAASASSEGKAGTLPGSHVEVGEAYQEVRLTSWGSQAEVAEAALLRSPVVGEVVGRNHQLAGPSQVFPEEEVVVVAARDVDG